MASDQQFCLRWNNHQNTLVSILDSLLDSGTLVDCTLAAEGRFLQAHKVVLSACSPYFAMLLREHYDKFPILILKDIKYQELQAMMNYMYRGEVNITQETLGSFLKAAESLQIRGLTDNSSSGGSSSSNSSSSSNNHHHHHNNHCGVENNNGMVRDSSATTHPYHGSGGCNSILNKKIPDPRKLVVPPHTPPLLSQQPSPLPPQLQQQQSQQQQQRSRSPQAASLLPQPQQQSHKKYLKSPAAAVVAGILENHHSGAPVAAAVASKSSSAASASEPSSLDTSSCSSSSTKRRKLLPPIKSESLVVTPINPATAAAVVAAAVAASGYNSLGAADSPNEVASQQLQPCAATAVAASEGKPVNVVGSPSMPPKVESPRMDASPVAAAVPTKGSAEPLIKAKPLAELVKVKSEQLDDSYNEDTNDDSLTTEENCDIDRDENSQLGGSLPFPNSQSGQNFENLERSLVSQDGSLQDTSVLGEEIDYETYESNFLRLAMLNNGRKYKCSKCNKMYRYKCTLQRHITYECGKQPNFHCPYCPVSMKRKSNLLSHIAAKHSIIL